MHAQRFNPLEHITPCPGRIYTLHGTEWKVYRACAGPAGKIMPVSLVCFAWFLTGSGSGEFSSQGTVQYKQGQFPN